MKKILIFVMFAVFFALAPFSVSAEPCNDSQVKEFVDSVATVVDTWTNPVISRGDYIYGEGDKQIGYLYRIFEKNQQKGYVFYLDSIGIAAAAWEGEDSAKDVKGRVYFIAPNIFVSRSEFIEYQKNLETNQTIASDVIGSTVYHVTNGSTGEATVISDFTLDTSRIPNLSSNTYLISTNYAVRKTITNTPDYNWFLGCAPTAGGMFVGYFDNEVWESLSPYDGVDDYPLSYIWVNRWLWPDYAKNYDEVDDLIEELASSTYFNTNLTTGGTSIAQMNVGLEDYFSDHGLSTYKVYLGAFNTTYGLVSNISNYQTLISQGNPVIISMLSHPTYGDHGVLGMGYLYAAPSSVGAIIHDTWSSEEGYPVEVFVSYSLLYGYSFIYND
ncbi:MAG: hypothetical protein ABII85_06365 [Bacillota bacterium]